MHLSYVVPLPSYFYDVPYPLLYLDVVRDADVAGRALRTLEKTTQYSNRSTMCGEEVN